MVLGKRDPDECAALASDAENEYRRSTDGLEGKEEAREGCNRTQSEDWVGEGLETHMVPFGIAAVYMESLEGLLDTLVCDLFCTEVSWWEEANLIDETPCVRSAHTSIA